MSILEIKDLSHSFGDKTLYSKVSLSLYKGEHMGIVGANGSGKSTLIKILTGDIISDEGYVIWQQGLRIGHLDQYAGVNGEYTISGYLKSAFDHLYRTEEELNRLYDLLGEAPDPVIMSRISDYQNILLNSGFYDIDTETAKIASGLGLTALGMERKLSELSGGQREKVILANLLLSEPDVLLLDEPTNFLDKAHISWLADYLSSCRSAFIVVSHDFEFLNKITTCICDIEYMELKKYSGSYSHYLVQKEQHRRDYIASYLAQKRETEKLETYIAKNKVRAATAKIAHGRQIMLDRIERLPPPTVTAPPRISFDEIPVPVSVALSVNGLVVGYDFPLLPDISFKIKGGQKTAVIGFNGIGKSTLLKTLMGIIPGLSGKFSFGDKIKIAYYEQDSGLDDTGITPIQYISELFPELNQKVIRSRLSMCGIRAKNAVQPLNILSGGEKSKVKLCALTMTASNFLILDEPTNHLDAAAKDSLIIALRAYKGSAIIVSHEAAFYESIADSIIDIEKLFI